MKGNVGLGDVPRVVRAAIAQRVVKYNAEDKLDNKKMISGMMGNVMFPHYNRATVMN